MDVNQISTCCVTLEDASSSSLLNTMSVKTATDIKQHLALLEHEKELALDTALRDDPPRLRRLGGHRDRAPAREPRRGQLGLTRRRACPPERHR
jgi:hypothetical protein